MVDKNNKQKLYEALSADYDMGSFEQFSTDVEDEAKRQKLYDAIKDEYELPDFNQFTEQLLGAKQQRETAAAKGDAEGASTFSEAEIKAETAAAEPQPANDLPIPQAQGKSTSSTPTPGAWPYAGAYRMQDGYLVSNAPGRDTGWRLTNEDGTPRTWAENVEATKTDEQRTREQFGEHRSGMLQDLLTDHAKTKAVPSERVVVDSEGNEVERYEVTPELSQEEAEYQARDDYYKKVKLDGERWAELEAARKQVYDEYNKELGKAHKEISELYQYVDAGAPVDIYDKVSNRRDVKALKGALKYYDDALTMVKEARATNDSPNNFLGELAGLGRGLLDAGLDVSTWDMGMSDLDQGASTLSAILKLEAGKELTSAEQRLLAAAAANTYASSSLGEQMGMGYKAGQTTMMSVPFMIEMALNPASGLGSAGSKALSKHLIKKYGREMIQKQLKKRLARQTMAAKWGTKIGGDAASAGVMTLTSGAAMTAADAVDRMTGTIKPTEDEEGNIVYGGRDDDYEKSVWTAARKAIGSGTIERHTEMVGGYIPAMKTAGATFLAKKMKAATNPRLRKIYREAEELLSGKAFGKWGEMVGKVADVTKLNDLAGEFFEEKIGEVENAILVGDMKFDANSQTGIFNLDRNIETLVGLLPMQVFFGGMTALGYRTQKYRTNQALNKANKAAWETFGEDWIEMKDMIDGCETDKDLTKVVRGIISGGTTDLRSQAAVMQYVSAVQRQKGLQLVAETAPEIVAQAEAEDAAAAAMPQPTENGGATSQTAYDRGVAAAEADDYAAMSDIGYESDLADARIERMFDEAQRAEIAEAENTEGGLETWLESNRENLSAEQAFAVQALIDANDAYDGLTETVRHRTASEEEAIRQEMQPLATADGRIVPLTLDNGQTVYLKSGDPTNRRSTVIAAYRDETGAVRNTQVSGMSITSIGTEQSLSDYTLEAMGNISNERQQRIKDAMDGKNVAAGQTVRLYAGDELQEYEVTAVAPEGATLRSKQDGSEMTMTTEELQDELAMSRQKKIENDLAAAMPQPTENTGATVAAAENTEGAVTAAAEAAKEEERRKPLRARVAQWSQDIGADIEIHEDTNSITSSAVLNQINSGQGRVRGWYDNATGKVHVYMPGITDEHDIDETVIHEIVAHKGLRQLMGPRFDALCDKVYEMMSEDTRQKYLAYPGVNGDTRAAADEYMAYLAENMENLTAEEQNVWQAIVAAVREFIKSVMTGSQMTDAQIEQLIRASYLNMKAQRKQTTEAAAEPQLTENTRAAAAAEREQTVEAAAQVAEKENLEEQENAEKNVSLQTKEGRMGVVARQKNSAARLAKAKEIYGSDPTTAPFFDDMDVPQTAEELVAMTLVPRSINWEGIDRGTQHIRGLQEEMGRNKKRGIGRNFDTNGFNLYLAKKGEGVGIEKLVEDIWRSDKNGMGEGNMLGDQRRFDEHEIKDALLSLLSGAQTSKDISDYVLNNRIAQAEASIEYMEEEAAYEQELYEQERREDARLAGILELTEDDWLQMEAEYADKIAEIEAKEREQREIFQQILEQDHQQAEYYGRANQEEVASERGIRMAEESAERGTVGSAERGETVLRGAQDTRDEGLSVGDAQLSEGALGAQDGRDGRGEDVHTQEAERSDVGETEALPQFTEELERQKAETNTNPTEAQKEAGNYKKGHLTFGGYKFTIENPKGSVRSGKNKKGKAWKVTMPVTYGYILGKKGKDGDHLDMFINDKADLSTWNGSVFVVDQVNPETGEFDEHKIMYGFNDITDAIRAYLMSYTRPWRGMGNITEVSKEKFDEWVASSDRKLKPFAETRFGDKADVGTKVIRAAEERAGKRQEGETPEQDRDKQIEKAYKRGYNSYRREQYTDETLLEMYASMSNEAIEADISKMERSIEEEKAYKDSEEYQERRSNESSDYTRAQTEGVAARAGKSVKALETKIAEAKRVMELRSMEERSAEEEEQVSFSIVTDPKKIAELEASPKRTGYRNVKLNEDGTFSSPMGYWLQSPKGGAKTRTKTDNFELGKWEEAQENPDLVDESNHIVLVKPDKGTVPVAYDPYIHNRLDPVNLQFKDAWKRDDLVYVETEVAETDLNSGYHADKALYPVGVHSWSNGDLMLSKYDKPVRVLPWEEVADAWAERLNGEGVNFDRVPKALRPMLIERGIEILPPTKGMGKDCKTAYEEWKNKNSEKQGVRFSVVDDGTAAMSQYTEEEQGIVDEAKKSGTWMKAPNGKPTNLTEKQWAQVRTKAFKKWFGDWEKVLRIEKLRKSKPVDIVFNGEYELNRDSAKQWMKDNIRGEYINASTGEKIAISKVGINEVTSHGSLDIAHLKSLFGIPQMIKQSVFIDEFPNTKEHDKYDSYRYYVCGIKIDGEDYTVKIVVGVKNGNKYYDHRLTQIEKGTLIDNLNGLSNSVAENQNADISVGKDTKLLSILQTNSSKIVDENGEPMVVYHDTNSTIFINRETGENWDDLDWRTRAEWEERDDWDEYWEEQDFYTFDNKNHGRRSVEMPAFFFTPNYDEYHEYGDRTIAAFLNIRNPKIDPIIKDAGVTNTAGENAMNALIEEGYDGFIRTEDGVWYETNAFYPNQIKSATDNVGTFDEGNEDIRFSVANNANNLVVMHNISEGDLRKVLETGGLIMPSIAITDVNIGFSGFGDISLLFDKETINPSDRRNKVYGGDAWTPRFPQLVPKLNKEKVKSVADKLYELLSKDLQDYFGLSSEVHSGNIEDNIIRGGIASYYSKDFMKIAYLLDNGKKFKVPMKPKPYGRMSEIIIRLAKEKGVSLDDINNAGYEFYENNPDFVDAIKLADAEARTQNLSSEVREKVRDMILEKPMHFSTFDRAISAARSMEYDLNNGGLKQVVDGGALYEAINKKVKTDNADYNKWVDDLFDGIIEKYGIRNNKDWYTPSGNQRSWEQLYDAATPSNILRYMIAQNTQGGSGGLFDSSIFGASAEEYKSIEEIRERGKKRLHKEESDDYDEWIESVTSRISDIKNEFLIPSERNDFRSSADANDAIVRAVAKDKTAKGIYSIMKRDYRNFTMEHAKMVADIVKEIQDKSVTYFEAKPQRIVPLSEIRKAIVPSNVDSDIIEGLRKNGIEVATYRRGNENARNRLIKKESNEIRFSFIGEQGASNLDKAEEATTRLDNLNVAREMEEAGKDAKSIKMATGWERGADKKWRYEVDDNMEGIASPMDKLETLYKEYKAAEKSFDRLMETSNRLSRLPRTATEEQKAKRKEFDNRLKEARKTWLAKRETFMEADNRRNFTLEEILGADHELFAAYPQLKTSEVSFMDKSDYAGYSGVYMPESGNFWISPTADNPMSTLTHEIQHAIQHIEGFAQGGNTRSVQTKAETLKKDVQPLYEMIHDTPEWAEYKMLVNDYFDEYGKDQLDNDKIAEIESRLNEIEDSGVLKEIESKRKELKRKYGADATVTKILNGPFSSFDEIWEQLPSGFYDKFDAYYRLGGEVEARNAAERMGMSSEERRASLAEETEDVAREDQVFIFDGLESAAMPQSTKLSASNKAVAMYDKANGTNVKGFFNYLRNNKQAKKGEPTSFHIGNAGSLLEQYGIKGKFMVGQFTFSKGHTDNEEHHLSVNDWVNVINNLNNPLAITNYKGMPNQYRIYTYAMINGKNICVGVNVSLADGEIALSNIISAYGRDINKLLGKEKTNLIYPDIEELKRRISQVSTGHDSPLNATSTASGDKGTEKDSDLQGNEGKVSFSVRDWRKEIRDAAEANGTWLKAPNGNKSNLNRYDWVTVRGEKFKKWFGDWENGNANNPDELDANGEPLKESIDKYKTIKPIFKEGFKKWFGDWENGEVKRPDLLDSNGMPSEEAISRYVRFESFLSDEFKQWFGDWENGETNFPGLTDSDGNPKEIALTHYYKHKTIHSKSFKEWLGDWENGSARFAMVLDEDGLPYDWVVTAYRTRPKYPTKPEKETGESQAVYFSRYRLWERAKDGYQSVADKYLDDVLNGRLEQAQSEESFIEKAQAQYEIDLAKWKEEQGIPDDATPEEEQPMPLPGERSLDYANRLTQWQRRQAAWKLAPKLENYIQAAKDDYLVYLAKYEVSKYPHSRASNIKLESAQLAKLRHAVARQKSYDKNTVQAVVDFAQQFLMQGFGDNISRGDIRHLLSAVRNATGVKDIKQNIDKIIDILVDNHIRNIENAIQKMASIKAHKMNAQNVSVQGKLELRGQRLIKAYNEARATNMTIEELEDMLSSLTEKMVDADPDTAAMYSAEYDGYSLALMYAKDITKSLKEYTLMRRELRDAESNRELTYREKAQLVEQLRASMLDNRVERIHRYSNFIDEFSRYLDESIEGAKDFNEAQKRHQAEIYNMAMSDLAGVSSGTDLVIDRKSESLMTRLSNSPLTQFFSSPLATFEQILKLFGQKYADGRGRLYNYFMQKWAEATRNEWSGKQEQFEILDDKAREIFGDKVKRWSDLYSIVGKMPGIEVSYLDVDGIRKTTKLTQGNLLYIYMANKMTDGAIKLRKQGISESDMAVIAEKLDPRLKSLADWVQSDFFVESRKKYNKIHMRLFGAPMAEIENYVPIRILSDARYQEQDVARLNKDTLPSTVTGAIVNRRMNSLPLDITGTDALSLVIEHVEEMEHWAAFAEFSKDISTLLSYTPFRNKVKNMQTVYGSGDTLWDRVMEVSNLAAGTYRPVVKRNTIDNAVANISKGLTLAKVAFRINTALKQLVSAIGFLHDIDIYNLFQNPFKAWNWAIKSMPQFQERWLGRKAGDTRLEDSDLDWKQWRQKFIKMSAYYGMTPNAFVDAVVSSCGAYAVYKTKYKRYKKTGYDNEQAHQKALLDAEQSFNLTQQSSKGAYIATIQADRTVAASALSVFRNSSFSFTRQSVEAFRNLRRKIGRGYKKEAISHMKRQMMLDGIPEDKAEAAAKAEYSRSIRRDLIRIVVFSYMNTIAWQLAGYWSYLLFGDDDEEKEQALKDALIRGMLAGPIEGLAGGNILSDLIGISVSSEGLTTEGLKNYRFYGLPAFSDLQKMIETFEHDQIAGLQDVINLLVQIGVGTNPETLTNSAIALIDYCNGDLDSAFELGLLLLRLNQSSSKELDNYYIDALGMSSDEIKKADFDELAKRWATYKMRQNAPMTSWLYSDEREKKKLESYMKAFDKKVQKRMEGLTEEQFEKNYNRSESNAERLVAIKIGGDREGLKHASKMKNAHLASYLKKSTWDDIREDMEIEKKKRELAPVNKRLEELKDSGASPEALNLFVQENTKELNLYKTIVNTLKDIRSDQEMMQNPDKQGPDELLNGIRQKRKELFEKFK